MPWDVLNPHQTKGIEKVETNVPEKKVIVEASTASPDDILAAIKRTGKKTERTV